MSGLRRAVNTRLICAVFFATLALVLAFVPTVARADGQDGTVIAVKGVDAAPGDTARVAVTVKGNPGILGAVLKITYDEGLTLKSVENGEAASYLSMTKPGSLASPCKFSWDGVEVDQNAVKDGEFLVLTFEVAENVESGAKLNVRVTGDAGAVVDGDLNSVDVSYQDGAVTAISYFPGDVDGNKLVNSRDVIFARRHIVGGYDQDIFVPAADVNADSLINSSDVILMRRYITGGYNVKLLPSPLAGGNHQENPNPDQHEHDLEAVAAKNPTCTETGNIAYWHCKSCDKYYSDEQCSLEISRDDTVIAATGHVLVKDPGRAPAVGVEGLTDGWHCSVCEEVITPQQPIPPLEADEHYITYDIANGDSYLAGLDISNPNKTSYYEGDSFKLSNLSVPGYRFLGWYDGAGDDATKVTRIEAGSNEDYELYAHWQLIPYTVQFESDLMLDTDSATFTVDKGLVLPTPKLSNYVFAGWNTADGTLYDKRIPVGSTGNITLKANWTSERNRTYSNPNPSKPIVYEDEENNTILLTYEIGRIENVPLYTIKDFGYINGGISRHEQAEYTATTSKTTAESLSNAVSRATTSSSNWVLSDNWNKSTSINEEWCNQRQLTKERGETIAKNNTSNWNVSNSKYGSTSSVHNESASDSWTNDIKINAGNKNSDTHTTTTEDKNGWKNSAELDLNFAGKAGVVIEDLLNVSKERSIGFKVGGEKTHESTETTTDTHTGEKSFGIDIGGSQSGYGSQSDTTTNTSGWNCASSYGGSSSISQSNTTRTALSELVSKKTGYGETYIQGHDETHSQGFADTRQDSESYSSTVTFNDAVQNKITSEWDTTSTKPGYHRWIVAGTAHVFGVVGYDINEGTYFVNTLTVMDDETHEFEDYSNSTAGYNDNENGVISFEVPYDEVVETVFARTHASNGLKVDPQTGTVTEYNGTDTLVVIPEYYNAGNGDVVKITGISPTAFAGNTDIVTVVLSDYITEIPDGVSDSNGHSDPVGAFEGCTSLAYVQGKGVTSIGARAFANCPSMVDCGVSSQVSHLGEGAFAGAENLYVNASNRDVAMAACKSGAKNINLSLRLLEDQSENAMDGATLDVPNTVEKFVLDGEFRTFNGMKIDSKAGETVLNKVLVTGKEAFPVKIDSPKATLNQSTISSPGISLVLLADSTELGLRGTTVVSSTSPNAMLCKNVSLYETANDVVGKLQVQQKLLVCGTISGRHLLECDQVETIDQATYDAWLNPCTITFDANGGTCGETTRVIANGAQVGELPVPTKDYMTFDGWFLKETGAEVKADTILPVKESHVFEAHWSDNPVSGWVKKSEMPSDGQIINTKWTYRLNVYRQDPVSYTYYRWCTYYDGIWNQDSCQVNASSVYHEGTVSQPLTPQPNRFADMGGNSAGICGPAGSCEHKREGQSFWWLKRINYTTVLDHVENKESTTQPSGNNITDVTEWVQYRPRTAAEVSSLSTQSTELDEFMNETVQVNQDDSSRVEPQSSGQEMIISDGHDHHDDANTDAVNSGNTDEASTSEPSSQKQEDVQPAKTNGDKNSGEAPAAGEV